MTVERHPRQRLGRRAVVHRDRVPGRAPGAAPSVRPSHPSRGTPPAGVLMRRRVQRRSIDSSAARRCSSSLMSPSLTRADDTEDATPADRPHVTWSLLPGWPRGERGHEWTVMTWNIQGTKATDLGRVARGERSRHPTSSRSRRCAAPGRRLAKRWRWPSLWHEKHHPWRPFVPLGRRCRDPHTALAARLRPPRVSDAGSKRSYRRRIAQWTVVERADGSALSGCSTCTCRRTTSRTSAAPKPNVSPRSHARSATRRRSRGRRLQRPGRPRSSPCSPASR